MRGTPVLVLILATYYMPAGLGLEPRPDHGGDRRAHGLLRRACRRDAARRAASPSRRRRPMPPRSIGLTFGEMLVYVLLPQAIRQIAPNFVNTAVEIVKASSLLSAIGVGELLLTTQEVIGRTFMTMEFYALAGAPLSRHQPRHRRRAAGGSSAASGCAEGAAWNPS